MDFIILGNSGGCLKIGGMFGIDVILSFYRAYNVVFGLFQAPYYAFSQTMMAELSPPGFDNMVEKSRLRSLLTNFNIPKFSFSDYLDFQTERRV